MILALINNKGGTGKTTSAVNLAAALAMRGSRALLVDLDSQASASLSMGIERAAFTPSVADAILAGKPLKPVIRRSAVEGLDLVTGSPDLANADLMLASLSGRERRLKDAVALYEQAAAATPVEAMERLDVELAKAELAD